MNKIILKILDLIIKKSNQQLLIPFYHAVTNSTPSFIGSLYPPREIENFERDLDVMLELYEPISLEKLIEIVSSGNRINKNYFHLTFDDGLANFYEVIAPILVKRKIPATVFVNSNFIDNKELFFRYKVSLLIDNYKNSKEELKNEYTCFVHEKNPNEKSVINYLLAINYNNKEVLNELALKVGLSFSSVLEKQKPYLTSSQIKELINNGFTIGAHSVDHPFFMDINQDNQLEQVKESLKFLKNNFNIEYSSFSFPFADYGLKSSFFKSINENNSIDISFGTSGIKKDKISNNFQRISFEFADSNLEYFLLKEYLKYFMKIPFGKNKMDR